jgi:hypothetical protein
MVKNDIWIDPTNTIVFRMKDKQTIAYFKWIDMVPILQVQQSLIQLAIFITTKYIPYKTLHRRLLHAGQESVKAIAKQMGISYKLSEYEGFDCDVCH